MVSVIVDKTVYADAVISKAVYWESGDFVVYRKTEGSIERVSFTLKQGHKADETAVAERFFTRLNDFKLQQIVNDETKDIRTILYVKAFAHNDDFEETAD